MRHSLNSRGSALLAVVALTQGCVAGDDDLAASRQGLDAPGPWAISAETYAAGDDDYVLYTGAGAWNDGADCSGGLTTGAGIVRSYLLQHFPQTGVIGGYACRQNTANTAQMSIHAVGRALDIMLPLSNGTADNDLGDPIGAWLIENAETIGIQYIIWDEWTWMAARTAGAKGKLYTGPNPHHDHLHVELSAEAGAQTSDWFSGLVTPPLTDGCVALGATGGVIDELEPCFESFGPANYWRHEAGVGYGGSLTWTNAWTASAPSNWARWNVALEESGDYEVEVFLTDPFAVYGATRYTVRHAGAEETLFVDQGLEAGDEGGVWVSLGVYAFGAGADQWVAVYDDVSGAVASGQHVAVDALRLSRVGATTPPPVIDEPPATGTPDGDVDPDAEDLASPPRRGGCSVGGSDASSVVVWIGVALAAVRRRRTRRAPSRNDAASARPSS